MSDPQDRQIRMAAVLGTARPGNFTSKALALVIDEIEKKGDIAVDQIDPATLNLPLPGLSPDSADTKTIQEIVLKSTGVIFSTPEPKSQTKLWLQFSRVPSRALGRWNQNQLFSTLQ